MGGVGRGVARTFVMCRPFVSLRRIAPKGGTCRCRMGSHPLSGGGGGGSGGHPREIFEK